MVRAVRQPVDESLTAMSSLAIALSRHATTPRLFPRIQFLWILMYHKILTHRSDGFLYVPNASNAQCTALASVRHVRD